MTEHVENKRSAVFLMDQCGSAATFQGCLRITAPTRSRGEITNHYCFVGGIRELVAKSYGLPSALTPSVEAPMRVLWPWYNRQCPFTLAVAFKSCYEGHEIAKWDSRIDYVIYLPDAEITDEGFSTNLTQGINDTIEPIISTVTLNVADWLLFEKHSPGAITTPAGMTGNINAVAYCGGPLCSSLSAVCNQPYDPGCQTIWVGGEDGLLFLSTDGGNTWTNMEDGGGGPLDLEDALYGTLDVEAIYCDQDIVLVSTEDGCVYYSADGGTTWQTPSDCSQMIVAFSSYYTTIWGAGDGLWKSTTDGASWTQVLTGEFEDVHFTADGVGVAITTGAAYISTDGGGSWTEMGASGLAAQADVWVVGGRIWIAGGDGMAYTNDQGENWTSVSTDAWDDMLWLNCYVGYRVAGSGTTLGPLQYTLDGGNTWWNLTIDGHTGGEALSVLAGCYDRMFIGGETGFMAELVTKARIV
jgi:photosystem II stability/assembly factor-like uncharacterized protein